jgi:hypothetical protein
VELTIASQKSRENESWQAIKDRDFVNAGLPKFSVSLHENIMYNAGYARRRPGWKLPLNDKQKRERLEWALVHIPDKDEYDDSKGFDFTQVIFTNKTPARIGEEHGMQRVWCKDGEQYDEGVKRDRNRRACCLQFYGAFRYEYKGPCYTYFQETAAEKQLAEEALEKENKQRKHDDNTL